MGVKSIYDDRDEDDDDDDGGLMRHQTCLQDLTKLEKH
jgi:hypothetical protein